MFAKLHGVRQISPLDTGSNLPQLQSLTVSSRSNCQSDMVKADYWPGHDSL